MFNVQVNNFGTSSVGNFSMKFANGYTVSLAMGDGIYSNGTMEDGFSSVEVAAWDAEGNWIQLGDNNDVIGWQSPEEVLAIMNKVAAM
jgi:hypothetical protein